eukprot:5821236-Pyramimonas_sp.AAC.1
MSSETSTGPADVLGQAMQGDVLAWASSKAKAAASSRPARAVIRSWPMEVRRRNGRSWSASRAT